MLKRFFIIVCFAWLVLFLVSCSEKTNFAKGYIKLGYDFNAPKKMEPSFQTAVWLENNTGHYIKSLMVTEYLSMGGYHSGLICPDWIKVVQWDSVSDEECDAVTTATPPAGSHYMVFDCVKEKLIPGKYKLCMQTHIEGKYNILFCGLIEIGKDTTKAVLQKTYFPAPLAGAENILDNVIVTYLPYKE